MYRNNVLNIKVNVTSSPQSQDKIIYKKDLLKLQKNIAKYYKVKPQINVLFKDDYVNDLWSSSTVITEYMDTAISLRIMAFSDDEMEISVYDFIISPTNILIRFKFIRMQNIQ